MMFMVKGDEKSMKKKTPFYPTLEAEIAKNGIKKKDIAAALEIEPRSLSDKLAGKSDFWWKEINVISKMFPDVPLDRLFSN